MAEKEAQFFYVILLNMKNKAEVDWAAVAEQAGLKNANSASTRFGQIKKKIEGKKRAAAGGAALPAPEKKPAKEKSPRKRKSPVKKTEEEKEDEEVDQPSPSKKPKSEMKPKFENFEDAKEEFDDEEQFGADGLDFEDV